MLLQNGEECQPLNEPRSQKSLNNGDHQSLNNYDRDPSLVLPYGITSIPVIDWGVRDRLGKALLETDMLNEYWKWDNCQKRAFLIKCLECEREFYIPFRCDLRICPACNQRYGQMFKARYLRVIRQLLKHKKGKDRLMLLTLSTKNTGEIPDKLEIQAHNKAIGKLIKKFFKGGVSVNEVKETFLHSHCIIYGPYVPQKKLATEWEILTGNKIVFIQAIKQKTSKVVDYICKYIKKSYQLEDTQQGIARAIQFLKNFKGVRRVHSFGIFYASKKIAPPAFVCPYCESDDMNIFVREERSVRVLRMTGVLSYKQVLRAWVTPIHEGMQYASA